MISRKRKEPCESLYFELHFSIQSVCVDFILWTRWSSPILLPWPHRGRGRDRKWWAGSWRVCLLAWNCLQRATLPTFFHSRDNFNRDRIWCRRCTGAIPSHILGILPMWELRMFLFQLTLHPYPCYCSAFNCLPSRPLLLTHEVLIRAVQEFWELEVWLSSVTTLIKTLTSVVLFLGDNLSVKVKQDYTIANPICPKVLPRLSTLLKHCIQH